MEYREIKITANRALLATPVFDSYWHFACERQAMFMRRVEGRPAPWTTDRILGRYRFTNVFRASDRVSQYLIRNVIYAGSQEPEEVLFRILLFKVFNRIDTWEHLCGHLSVPSWAGYNEKAFDLSLRQKQGPTYSAAYIMPNPPFDGDKKHLNHLRLIEHMMRSRLAEMVKLAGLIPEERDRARAIYSQLLQYPSIGEFLACQLTTDINYSTLTSFSENAFVVAGPGARGGIKKCFANTAGLSEAQVIEAVCERQEDEIKRLGLWFDTLWGRKLHLTDCQGLFCETDKYAREAHPDAKDITGRTKIKQIYKPDPAPLPKQWYPPKWGINDSIYLAEQALKEGERT